MENKKKILFLSDHPLVQSGVGTQAKYLIEGLLATGKYRFYCLGGAIKHADYRIQKVCPEKYGDDWIIHPVNGYGDKVLIRQILTTEKPDALIFFTDPRFFVWLWEMEDEIRSICPMIYNHVWDSDPIPQYNKVFYDSTDYIVALSLKTYGLLQGLNYKNFSYVPHSISEHIFKPLPENEIKSYKDKNFGPHKDKKFLLFWNNRNARRKCTGDVVASFSKFANIVGKENVALFMHTAVHDPEGQDITALAKCFNIETNLIISEQRVAPEELNKFYNVVDCTINIASNEGFGLATLESLSAGTLIVANFTGGLQFQVGPWWEKIKDFSNQDELTKKAKNMYNSGVGKWFGIPIFPASRSCTGSQQIPYIYNDLVNHDDVVKALVKLYNMGRDKRRQLGLEARDWAIKNFNQNKMISNWDKILQEQISKYKNSIKTNVRIIEL